MRIDQMREREDFDAVLRATLETAWAKFHAAPVRVELGNGRGQRWRVQPLLSAYFTPRIGEVARRFLRDSFRFTPRRARLLPQFALGTALATRPGLAVTSSPGFSLSPGVEREEDLIVIPGNRRIRIFDFGAGTSLVVSKHGFDASTMCREIDVRASGRTGPFPSISQHAPDGTWFVEPIIDGYALPRCPPWYDRAGLERLALSKLAAWTRQSVARESADEYVGRVAGRIRDRFDDFRANGFASEADRLDAWLDDLSRMAATLGQMDLALTHGDLQAGNILVSSGGLDVMIIDWEHSARRSSAYDALVHGLVTRLPGRGTLDERVREFIAGTVEIPHVELSHDGAARRATAATFALEDIEWTLRESFAAFRGPSPGLLRWLRALERHGGPKGLLDAS